MAYAKKEKIRVMIYTSRYRIEGDFYMLQGSRLTDMLNVRAKDFFPLTNVKIFASDEDRMFQQCNYAAVMREAIIAIAPIREIDEGMIGEEQ